jgi:AAA domain
MPTDWLWHGFVSPGNITLLTSLWKSGKTTLLSLLLSRRKTGGTLGGLAVKPGKTVVVSEEPQELWTARARQYPLGGQVCFLCKPFRGLPDPEQWQALIDRLLSLQHQHGIDLAAIDPLAPFLRVENNARGMLETLLPLSGLTRRGMAVLLLHHPGKGARPIGQAARGSGALLGHVDIAMEMRHPGGEALTRRRRFYALSRHAETPRQLLLELNAEGTDYVPVSETEVEDGKVWEPLRMVLEDAPQKLTRQDILDEWPADFEKPARARATLWRWLDRAVQSCQISCAGTGRKDDPLRYWPPATEARWREDFIYDIIEEQKRQLKLPFVSLREKMEKREEEGGE